MDAVSYSHSAKQAQRIEKVIANPDSTSGIVTVPKVIETGENITIPAGRVAVLPNVQVDGTLNIEGEVFIPSGATFGDLESQIASKVSLNEDEVIAGVKTFSSSPIVPTPTTGTQVANKDYVDSKAEVAFVANDARAKTALNATGNAPIYACRAWVNFNGTGTVAIRASGNVSSITDNGTGDYTVNFTTAMPNADYSAPASNSYNGGVWHNLFLYSKTSSELRLKITNYGGGATDESLVDVAIFS